jgi:nickel-type superoxide dismutase maturation protease
MRLRRALLRLAARVPGLYSLIAFTLAKRIVVRGRSMIPALLPGERVLFDRLAYLREEPQVGDIVLARHPARPRVRFIKRIAEVSAAGEYVLRGDNPDESTDSRALGPFRREDLAGRAWVVYWPADAFRVVERRSVGERP